MFCTKCGNEIPEGAQVCGYCGAAVNQNTAPNQNDRQGGIYGESAPSYSGQSPETNNYTYNNGSYQNIPGGNGYGTPQNMDGGSTGLAIASMILGIVALLVGCCAVYKVVTILCAVFSIVFGVLSMQKGPQGKGMAIAGIVCSIIALVVQIVIIAIGVGLMSVIFSEFGTM